jgi:hypothetical protein
LLAMARCFSGSMEAKPRLLVPDFSFVFGIVNLLSAEISRAAHYLRSQVRWKISHIMEVPRPLFNSPSGEIRDDDGLVLVGTPVADPGTLDA